MLPQQKCCLHREGVAGANDHSIEAGARYTCLKNQKKVGINLMVAEAGNRRQKTCGLGRSRPQTDIDKQRKS